MFSVVIVATALLGLQAAVTNSITSAADSVHRRAARALARSKMEEVLAGVIDTLDFNIIARIGQRHRITVEAPG